MEQGGVQTTLPGCASRYARALAESRERLYSSETEVVGEVGAVAVSGEIDHLPPAGRFGQADIDEAPRSRRQATSCSTSRVR